MICVYEVISGLTLGLSGLQTWFTGVHRHGKLCCTSYLLPEQVVFEMTHQHVHHVLTGEGLRRRADIIRININIVTNKYYNKM